MDLFGIGLLIVKDDNGSREEILFQSTIRCLIRSVVEQMGTASTSEICEPPKMIHIITAVV